MGSLTTKLILSLVVFSSIFNLHTAREGGRRREERKEDPGLEPNFYGNLNKKLKSSIISTNNLIPASSVFNVLNFGAAGNGTLDDTKAFQAAWAAACQVERSTVLVPQGRDFLVGPISFSGFRCKPGISFQLDGTITAPTTPAAWKGRRLQWLKFTKLVNVKVSGRGAIDGRGAAWWGNQGTSPPGEKPTALRFYGSEGITVAGITIRDSPQCHLKFDSCRDISVSNFTVSSPSSSPRTDGIHLQNSRNVSIKNVVLGCGDDCVSVQTGCSNVEMRNVACGPGHGISIGSLGQGCTKACVSNVSVSDVEFNGTLTGVRIKTWQGGWGYANNIRFSNIRFNEVETPVVIDQYYCDGGKSCRNQSSAVALAGISYTNLTGTFTRGPIHLACSDSAPCSGISLRDVKLELAAGRGAPAGPFCWQAHGQTTAPVLPPVGCLLSGAGLPGFSSRGSC